MSKTLMTPKSTAILKLQLKATPTIQHGSPCGESESSRQIRASRLIHVLQPTSVSYHDENRNVGNKESTEDWRSKEASPISL